MTLSSLCGVVMFSYYAIEGCDPLAGGRISDVNQVRIVFFAEEMSTDDTTSF